MVRKERHFSVSEQRPGLFSRIVIAFGAYFRALFDAEFAGRLRAPRAGEPALALPGPRPEAQVEPPKPVVLREPGPDAALVLLSVLQREGRFLDFVSEDVSSFSDAEMGAAARVVHAGCRKALAELLDLAPAHDGAEGARVTVAKGFDSARVRLVGKVAGEPPFSGTLQHRGWLAKEVRLPKLTEGHDPTVLAPAEVEL